MQIPITEIIVKKRIRKEMGDIPALAESMKRFGQMSPVILSKKKVLIAGGRRLEAARYLGWETINAVFIEAPGKLAKLEYEIEENLQRREFSSEEMARAVREMNRLQHPGFFRRLWNALIAFFKGLFKISDD